MIEMHGTKIERIKKLQYIGVDSTMNAFTFFLIEKNFTINM